ncbi:PhzF family phenazine biosynthesis protein [Solimonas marina]|uniref:PhzF family phenazine biosynthesis protein n=1 Tax=Solimonas marina TaxID=2714601 RepID=A0A970B7E6_9GAMM|nr:PhzF family phenazine biosynthesis protein [Solimonas marina]NKF21129.1 PhzF family phenazine biosynthesis protein [Solimonas marina]
MALRFHTLDVFTDQAYGGNPLAVVFGGDALGTAQMQRIAREFNLSETVFVLTPTRSDALHRIRIFTPTAELPFAGHPTIGTACLLSELGLAPKGEPATFAIEEGVGLVPIRLQHTPGEASYAELTTAVLPEYGPAFDDVTALAAVLGLEAGDLGSAGEVPRNASCGLPFLLVPLRSPELLAAIDFDVIAARRLLGTAWAQQLYVYARGYEGELRARMFAPALGMVEDPATGSAAAALAGALGSEADDDGRLEWTILQGLEMGRPSRIQISVDRTGGQVTAVRVGGCSVLMSDGLLGTG